MPLPEFELPDPDKQQDVVAEDDKFEVEIEDDTPPEDRRRRPDPEGPPADPTEDELSSYDDKVQARIKKFTRGYHDERRAKEEAVREREAAEAFAKQVFEENKRLQQQLATGSKAFIETSKSAAEVELEAAEKAYKQAYDDGNSEALVAAQKAITKATIKLERATDMKPIEVEDREFKAPAPAEADKPKLTPRTQKWVEQNSDWWGIDDEMTATAIGLDKKLAKEYGPDYIGTEEYFRTIDKTMRKRFPEHFEDVQSQEDDEPPPKKRTSEPVDEDEPPRRATQKITTVVAPASRSTPPNRVKLKASEAAIARRLGVPIEEYAKQVAQLRRG
jgi:hypothetical protein